MTFRLIRFHLNWRSAFCVQVLNLAMQGRDSMKALEERRFWVSSVASSIQLRPARAQSSRVQHGNGCTFCSYQQSGQLTGQDDPLMIYLRSTCLCKLDTPVQHSSTASLGLHIAQPGGIHLQAVYCDCVSSP